MANIDNQKVVKISKDELVKAIEKKAHDLFIRRDGKHGNDLKDWLEAEKIVKKQFKLK